jgi:hypothetical protein
VNELGGRRERGRILTWCLESVLNNVRKAGIKDRATMK